VFASLQAIPSYRNSNFPRSHSPLKLCAIVRVSNARDGDWGGDDAGDRDWGGDDTGDGGWGEVRALQVNHLLRFDFYWNFLTQ
jgi:hypothetical protein